MPIPVTPTAMNVKHPEYTDENGVTWIDTPNGRHIKGENEPIQGFYIGYSSNDGVRGNINGIGNYVPTGQYTGYTGSRGNLAKPKGYSRNAAATATDIAQGGMTKDELQEFNIRHPNETAGGI